MTRLHAIERSFEVDDGRLAGLALGETGPGLVLLHGFGSDRMSWYLNQTEAAHHARTLALDLPHHGQSMASLPDFSVEAVADRVARAIELFGAPVHLAGHSFGGAVALTLAARYPELVDGLFLAAPAGVGQRVNLDFIHAYTAIVTEDDALNVLRMLVDRPRLISKQMAARVAANLADPAHRAALKVVATAMEGLTAKMDAVIAEVAGLPIRRTVIWGEHDRVSPPDAARIARLKAEVAMVPGAGHLPHMENPALANRLLRALLAGG